MGKKKRQGDPDESDCSSDSHDENQNTSECSHVCKAINLTQIKSRLNKKGLAVECEECKNNPIENGLEMNGDFEYDTSLWLCLRCGNQACGRYKNQHALKHYKTPHSDCHSICVNTSTWSIYCYECDNEVNVTLKKKLLECVDYLQKHYKSRETATNKNLDFAELEAFDLISNQSGNSCLPKQNAFHARGLSNLGNTCFFNSVMQCLGQTPYLLELLEETSKHGQYFHLPGGKLEPENKDSLILESLEGYLEEWRPLTKILAETLKELKSERREVYSPRMLLSKLTQRLPQFGGGDQHDSHELLRHMLEAVREEDLRRYQVVILEKMGLSKKTDPTTVEGDKRKIVKFYGGQASDMLLPTEQVFKGILVSSLQCQDCEHTSHRDENFLDLSLPIIEKQIPPVLRRKADELDDKPSKHQIKKEKKAAKKNKKNKSHKNMSNVQTTSAPDDKSNTNNSGTESDADVEDNVEENSTSSVHNSADNTKGTESGYNSDKVENCSSSNRCSPDIGMDENAANTTTGISVSPMSPGSPENSATSSEANVEMGSPTCGRNTPNDEMQDAIERPESRMSFINNKNNDLKENFTKLSLCYGDGYKKEQADEEYEAMDDDDEKMEEDSDWTSTIAPRYMCKEGEFSLQSCLNQFTACELMTGNNKVSCELCTKRYGGSDKKTINTVAKKQLLIYNPPAVLILHLKRFQVYHFRSTKVSTHVKFPMLLDIAPFCSKRCQNLPTIEPGQTKVLYSLYGVVEHSGSIHGGHYVAYVKVRPKLQPNSYRWNFLPKNQKDFKKHTEDNLGAQGDPDIPSGKWFYISDTYVTEVNESKVLNAQAYLLFYERIL